MGVRVYAGLMLFGLTSGVGLYFLPRRLSRRGVEMMRNVLRPVSDAVLPLLLLFMGGSCLLILLGYGGPAERLMDTFVVFSFAIVVPVIAGHSAAHMEVSNREWAERMKRWKEEEEARKEELARLQKS